MHLSAVPAGEHRAGVRSGLQGLQGLADAGLGQRAGGCGAAGSGGRTGGGRQVVSGQSPGQLHTPEKRCQNSKRILAPTSVIPPG